MRTLMLIIIVLTAFSLARRTQAGRMEPNDDCFNSCDGMCRMCIMFCGFSSDDDKDLVACVRRCADLRFSCRMSCEVEVEGEVNIGTPPLDTTILASSSKNIKIKILDRNAVKKKKEREENYDDCRQYCVEIDTRCNIDVCRFFAGGYPNCYRQCGLGLTQCLNQCHFAYGSD